MTQFKHVSRWRYPATVWLVVLGAVFATEATVMVALPSILPRHPPRILEATVDAILLTLVLAPLLWLLLVRPLRDANRVRSEFLGDLFASIEAERREIAHDLHDGVGQSLTMLVSGLRSAAQTFNDPDQIRRCMELKQLFSNHRRSPTSTASTRSGICNPARIAWLKSCKAVGKQQLRFLRMFWLPTTSRPQPIFSISAAGASPGRCGTT
jgi:hypothetical protein